MIGGFVESGHVIDLEKKPYGYIFRLDSYGGCEGQYTIDESQIGISVFLTEEEAKSHMHEQKSRFSRLLLERNVYRSFFVIMSKSSSFG